MMTAFAARIDDRHQTRLVSLALVLVWLAGGTGIAAAQANRGAISCTPRPPGVACPWASPIQRGSIQVGGTATINRTRDIGNDQAWTTLELLPRIGYFVTRGLAVSANIRHRRIWSDDQTTVRDQTFTEWGIGPGLTYFVPTPSPRLFPFVSARTLFIRGVHKSEINLPPSPQPGMVNRTTRTRSHAWLGSAGAMFMIVEHVGVTGEAFYQRGLVTIQTGESGGSSNSSEIYGVQWGIAAFVF